MNGEHEYRGPDGLTDEQRRALQRTEIQRIMSTKAGRQLLRGLIDSCAVEQGIFDTDPQMLAYREGRRSVGVEMSSMLKAAAPGQYLKMIEENLDGN